MVLIPQHWSFRHEYSQDKSGIGKLAWKRTYFIKRDGTVKIRRSSRENRKTRKCFYLNWEHTTTSTGTGTTWSLKLTHGLPLVGHVRFALQFKKLYRCRGHRRREGEIGKRGKKGKQDGGMSGIANTYNDGQSTTLWNSEYVERWDISKMELANQSQMYHC
ncbi:hypothetical protein TNCV_1099931 [Trichonephila clavipes]|nr:hypothetical protein TNCV_1099931 [Trichonephila clavipes]